MPKRTIFPVENLSEDTSRFLDVLNESNGLTVVLVAASYIDASLAALLHRFFIESSISDKLLDAQGGALGAFTSRCDASYALALIDKPMYQDLIKIAEIRNEFAHYHLALDFQAPNVSRLCDELKYVKSLFGTTNEQNPFEKIMVNARDRFVITVVLISQRLLINGLGIKRQGTTD